MTSLDRRTLIAATAALGAATTLRAQTGAATSFDLKGKAILITGTSSGFGRLSAELFARSGAKVFATMRSVPRPEAEELRKLARDEKLDLTVLELNVLDEDQVNRAVAEAERLTG